MCKGLNKLSLYTLMFFIVSCVSANERILSPSSEIPDFNKINAK